MQIGGFQKTSLLYYPDTISAIIWTVGCNFSCPFCYNPQLVKKTTKRISEEESYKLSPAGVTIVEQEGNCNLFNLPNKLECVPGAPNGSAYTVGLTPGGLCGAQKCVDAAASYKIDKIGGPLV